MMPDEPSEELPAWLRGKFRFGFAFAGTVVFILAVALAAWRWMIRGGGGFHLSRPVGLLLAVGGPLILVIGVSLFIQARKWLDQRKKASSADSEGSEE
jgi:hypothetical protein